MDKIHLSMYVGEESGLAIRESITNLKKDGGFKAILVDTTFDDECMKLKDNLASIGINTTMESIEEQELDAMMNDMCRFLMEEKLARLNGDIDGEFEVMLEIGGLNGIQSGAMFATAMRFGASITYYDWNNKKQIITTFKPLPNVDRIGYYTSKMLDILHEHDAQDYVTLRDRAYADSIINMTRTEKEEFFKTHHNAYKTLEKLVEKGWVEKKPDKTYEITPEGDTARVMINIRDVKKK